METIKLSSVSPLEFKDVARGLGIKVTDLRKRMPKHAILMPGMTVTGTNGRKFRFKGELPGLMGDWWWIEIPADQKPEGALE